MKNIKSHFNFNKQERSGIFFLLLLICSFQAVRYFIMADVIGIKSKTFVVDAKTQQEIDALKLTKFQDKGPELYPFNPNFISDFKGYTLGMSPDQIDKLLGFRERGKFVNSASEFQKVTGVSDSLLEIISPYFKFRAKIPRRSRHLSAGNDHEEKAVPVIVDINTASAEQLKVINGIGEKLSARIIKFRDALGGFLIDDQLHDVYGLKPEVVERTLKKFRVLTKPEIIRINLNETSAEELSAIVYINYDLAKRIVARRTEVGEFSSFNELREIPEFPSEKIERIALYLQL